MNEAGDTLTVVVINREGKEKTAFLDFSGFGSVFPAGSRVKAFRTSGSIAAGEHWAELQETVTETNGCTAVLAPYSVTTYIIESAVFTE